MTPVSRSVERTQSTRSGAFPRFSAVPPPTGLTACPSAAACARNSATSWASPGTRRAEAETPSMERVRPSDFRLPTSDSLEGMDAKFLCHRLHAQGAHLSAHIALGKDFLRIEHTSRIEALLET